MEVFDAALAPVTMVYFALGEGTGEGESKAGLIKIGFSTNPCRRVTALKGIVLHQEPGDEARERDIHQMFSDDRVWPHAEWFHPSRELMAFILTRKRSGIAA